MMKKKQIVDKGLNDKDDSSNLDDTIESRLLRNHTFILSGEIDRTLIDSAIRWLIYENLNDKKKLTLTIYINSTGGLLCDSFALIDLMKNSKHTIRTIGIGSVMSSGFLIFASGTKGSRYIAKNSSILSHQYSEGLADSKHHDIRSFYAEGENTNERMVRLLTKCSNLSSTEVKRKLLPASDVWLKAEELIELGIADHIL